MASEMSSGFFWRTATTTVVGWFLFAGGASTSLMAQTASDIATCPSSGEISDGDLGAISHVRYLADDALEGREVGSAGARCAADYIAARFEAIGLEPIGDEGTFFQSFPIRAGSQLTAGNALRSDRGSFTLGTEWVPLGFSGSADVSAELVYGGEGINRPEEPDNDYPTLDLEGKILVVEYGDPRATGRMPMHGTSHFKATVAQGRGAAGVIVLLPDSTPLPSPSTETRAFLRIPVAVVRGTVSEALRSAARAGEAATIATAVEERRVQARNVVALLPGTDAEHMREILVIGAHYDHLGLGGENSLAPDAYGSVHNGADDNASGTGALIEVARKLAERGTARTVVFLAFTGEEKGLWGSQHYVRNPTFPLSSITAMLNMDMVGRLEGETLTVFGVGTAEEWTDLLEEANASLDAPIDVATSPDGEGPSDHAAFHREGVPVLHFFTNTHEDYHRPSDDWQKIDADGLAQVVDLVTEVGSRLAGSATHAVATITAVEVEPQNPHGGSIPTSSSSSSSGYGPYLGTIPDMSPIDYGVRLTGVRENSPAETGGLRKGDVIVGFAGREVGDLYAYTYALRDHAPGDEVEIEVIRDGERVKLMVVLGQR